MKRSSEFKRRAGFTLMEVLLAMLVFVTAITTILALLIRSVEKVNEVVKQDQAVRLTSTVENFFNKIGFDSTYNTVFVNNEVNYVAFRYRADPTRMRTDSALFGLDTPEAVPDANNEHVMFPAFWPKDYAGSAGWPSEWETNLNQDFAARDGNAFWVVVEEVVAPGGYPPTSAGINDPVNYPAAVVMLRASFYDLFSLSSSETVGDPIHTHTFGVRR